MTQEDKEGPSRKSPAPAMKKIFTYDRFDRDESWTLPTPANLVDNVDKWDDEELIKLKEELNSVKNSLNDIDIGKWHCHTGSTQLGGAIQRHVQKHAHAEICTQAWCKFHEILCKFDIVRASRRGTLKSVHLCEAPGAFVASLNHYLKSRGIYSQWEWLAFTLNPYYEGNEASSAIQDDTLIRETRPNWYFGADNSGNLLCRENLLSLVDRTGKHRADLVTADGSISCADSPADQECLVAPLIFAEVVAALYILRKHGSFVLKMFTLFEQSSLSLLYLLNFLFTEVYVFKPTASKPGNSEVYVVCEDYRGIEHSLLLKLTELVGTNEEFRLAKSLIPETFMAAHRDCCRYFSKLQAQTIQMNLDLYNRESRDWLEGVMAMRIVCAKQYLEENDIRPIHSHQKILQRERKPDASVLENGVRHALPVFRFSVSGSYNQRCANATLSWREKMREAQPYDVASQLTWLEMSDVVKPVNGYGLQLTLGKPVNRIQTSRYAHQQILDDYNAMLENAEHLKPGDVQDVEKSGDWSAVYRRLWESLTLRPTDVQCRSTDALHQKESTFIQYGTSHYSAHADYRFLLMDVTTTTTTTNGHESNNELTSKHELMRSVIEAMKVLEAGDCLVGRVFTALSRYTASIVYILKIMFYKVTITTLDDNCAPGYCYVVCCGFLGVDNCLIGRLTRAVKHTDDLLQLVPTDWLEYYPFRQKLTEMNQQIILSHLNRLIIREQDFVKLTND